MLAVSMGDHAGSLCCLKAELSGLRAKGPALAFSLPMRGTFGWGQETNLLHSARAKHRVEEGTAVFSSCSLRKRYLSMRAHIHTQLAKRFSQQALQGGGDRCCLLLINHNLLLTTSFCFPLLPLFSDYALSFSATSFLKSSGFCLFTPKCQSRVLYIFIAVCCGI